MDFTQDKSISNSVPVELSNRGWRKLAHVSHQLKGHFAHALVLKHEVSAYLASHEQAGIAFDTQCQELHYDDRIWLLLRKIQGIWYIIDVWLHESVVCSIPLSVWKQVQKYCCKWIIHLLLNQRKNNSMNSVGRSIF